MKDMKKLGSFHTIEKGSRGACGLVVKIRRAWASCLRVMVAKPSAHYARKVHGRRQEY